MEKTLYNLTNPQKSVWLTEQFYTGTSINNVCGTVIINENVNFDMLKDAINKFIENTDSFRLKLLLTNDGIIKQYFTDFVYPDLNIVNLNSIDELKKVEYELANTPLSLINNNLYKFQLFKLSNGSGGFIVNAHHLIADASTASILASKIMDNYSALLKNNAIPSTKTLYEDYINSEKEYLSSIKFKKDEEYWQSNFNTISEIGVIPTYKSNNASSFANRLSFQLNKNLITEINTFCKNTKVSIFNFLMGIYALYISRVSNLDSFTLGTPILNRSTFTEKQTPGMFISTVPFKFNINDSSSFIEFIKQVSLDTLSIFRHQKYPYQNILEYVRNSNNSYSNLYDILISYQNSKTNRNSSDISYEVRWTFNNHIADSLQIHISDINDEGFLNISYDYRINKYDELDIKNIHNRILFIINQILSNNTIFIKNIDIVTPQEKDLLVNKYNNTILKYDSSKTVIEYFEKQVLNSPEKIAITCNNSYLTYKQLNEKANQLAHYLISNNFHKSDIIGIMLPRSLEMIIGIIAILKIGATYLPIDPEYPIERIKYMLEDSKTKALLTNTSINNLIDNLGGLKIDISLSSEIYFSTSTENIGLKIPSSNLIYIIYTSGSTGKPKGVMVTHKNILNFVFGEQQQINFFPNKIMLSLTTICFDIFALELWCSLINGLQIIIATNEELSSITKLQELCIKYQVNIIQTTPSRYSAILSNKNFEFLSSFTDILIGGEPLPKSLLDTFKKNCNAKIFNMYGPTETTVWSTIKEQTNDTLITIGKPIANTSCYILDNHCHLLPQNTPGELYIGGDGVSNGYLNRPDLTKEKFITSPFDKTKILYNTNDLAYINNNSELIHLGRTDSQIKIRGYRIELEEVKNEILKISKIKNAIVICNENKFLICYYISDFTISTSEFTTYLLNYLPNYMIPSYFIKIEDIPLTPNGKLDKKLLPSFNITTKESTKNLSKTEKLISSLLVKLLNLNTINIEDSFFNMGLDSLDIIKIQTMLLQYDIVLTTQDFYKYPNIKLLANRIEASNTSTHEIAPHIPDEFKHKENELILKDNISHNIFLTGANGFLGIHILYELLNSTNNNIFCLVRGKTLEHSIQRLSDSYKFYFNSSLDNLINNRIFVINGYIDSPNFSIPEDILNSFINKFDTIIHTAAIVKHYGNYSDFENVNILGTKYTTELAYKYKKHLIYISSMSVSGNYLVKQNNNNVTFSENDLYIGQHYNDNVYVNSKLEAEKIIYSYMKKGLSAKILRIGILAGRYSDGVFQKNISENAFYNRIKSMIKISAISEEMLDQEIEFTPVDLCAKAIILLTNNQSLDNRVFHLYNNNLIKIKNLVYLLKDLNYNINILDKKSFNDLIIGISKKNFSSSLSAVINDISYDSEHLLNINYNYSVNLNSKITCHTLHKLGFDWPKTDINYTTKLLKYMKKVNFI